MDAPGANILAERLSVIMHGVGLPRFDGHVC